MKHIFVINNSTTLLLAKSIFDYYKLQKESACIIFKRLDKNLIQKVFSFKINTFKYPDKFHKDIRLRKNIRSIKNILAIKKEIDEWMLSVSNYDSYYIYLPSYIYFSELRMISHKKCSGFFVMEEGMAAYRNSFKYTGEYKKLKILIIHILLCTIRFGLFKSEQNLMGCYKFIRAYHFGRNAFPRVKEKERMEYPALQYFQKNISGDVLVIESLYNLKIINCFELYILYLKWLLERLETKKNNKIYYKLHPQDELNSNTELTNEVNNIMKMYNVIQLSQSDFLEYIAFLNNDVKFHLLRSSIAIYLSEMNAKIVIDDSFFLNRAASYSCANSIINITKQMKKRIESTNYNNIEYKV